MILLLGLLASDPQLIVEPPTFEARTELDELRGRAFTARFEAAALESARSRGFVALRRAECDSEVCSSTAASIHSSIRFGRDACTVSAWADGEPSSVEMAGCLSSQLLFAAESLPRRVLLRRLHLPEPTERLTSAELPAVMVASVPPIPAPSGLTGDELAEALARFRALRLETTREGASFSVFQGGAHVDDCALLTMTGRPVSRSLAERCSGNWFELSYGVVPIGLGIAVAGVVQKADPSAEAPLLLVGVGTAVMSMLIGLLLNEDGLGPGEHVIDPHAAQELVAEHNAILLERLKVSGRKLSDADLEVAGLSTAR